MRTLKDFDFQNKRVLVRCDFQVPLTLKGEILDDFRIRQTIPTIDHLIKSEAKIILMSHWKPEGKEKAMSLGPISLHLEGLLSQKINFLNDCIGERVRNSIEKMRLGEISFLENLRFYKEEEENDEKFAKELAELGDIYINDAFSVCHRAHASIVGIPRYLLSLAGFLLEKEIKILGDLMKKSEKPLVVIIGGAKIQTKTKMIDKFLDNADFVLIGELIEKEIKEKNLEFSHSEKIIGIADSVATFDLGPKTIKIFEDKIARAKTIFWSGPLGKVEDERFSKGTAEIVKAIVKSGAFSVAGGGETVEFINKLGLTEKFNHISTGGGAMLHFLAGEKLPGIEALERASLA